MKLNTRYKRIRQERPELSDTNCLANALIEASKEQDFYSKGTIARVFELVDKSDYDKYDKWEVLESLYRLNFEISPNKNGGLKNEIAPGEDLEQKLVVDTTKKKESVVGQKTPQILLKPKLV